MKVKVVLKLKDCSNAQVLINCDRYVISMTGNAHFAAPGHIEQVTKCKTCNSDLRAAINAPLSDTKADTIKIARDALDRNITLLGSVVEGVANDPAIPDSMREEIVHSAGMELRNWTRPRQRVFTAENTKVSGTVHLSAPGGAISHEWQYTSDVINFTGRIPIKGTSAASAYVENLKKLEEYAFFHRAVTTEGDTDFEAPVILRIL